MVVREIPVLCTENFQKFYATYIRGRFGCSDVPELTDDGGQW